MLALAKVAVTWELGGGSEP